MADVMPLNEHQAAIFGALDGNLSDGATVHDDPPQETVYDYIFLGASSLEAERHKGSVSAALWIAETDIHIYTRPGGRKRTQTLVNEILQLLDNAVLSAGWAFLQYAFIANGFAEFVEESEDGERYRHGILTVQSRIKPVTP